MKLKRSKLTVNKHRKIAKKPVIVEESTQCIDFLSKKDAAIQSTIEVMFWQTKKIADDNKYFFSNIRKFKQEESDRTKSIFIQLFGLLSQQEAGNETFSTPLHSRYTCKTDVTEINKFKVFKDIESKDNGLDSFKRITGTRSLLIMKPRRGFKVFGSEMENHFQKM